MAEFRHNHYVARWYQERFLPASVKQRELYYLHKEPRTVRDGRGRPINLPAVEHRALKNCFAQQDLYTLTFRGISSTELERQFFGHIDRGAPRVVDFWANYNHTAAAHDILEPFLVYLSTQKLRTPKGLDWLAGQIRSRDPMMTLAAVLRFRQVFGAVWSECIWHVADAGASPTKFIVSDHPVTLYNRECSPLNRQCLGFRRPRHPPERNAHDLSALDGEGADPDQQVLGDEPIYAANEDAPEPSVRAKHVLQPNGRSDGPRAYKDEVLRINLIIKDRAYRFIGAAKKDWLYPEEHLPKRIKWAKISDGYLLFPIRASSTTAARSLSATRAVRRCHRMHSADRQPILTMGKTAFRLAGRIRWHRSRASSPNSTALSVAVVAGTNRKRMARRCTTSISLAQRNQRRKVR